MGRISAFATLCLLALLHASSGDRPLPAPAPAALPQPAPSHTARPVEKTLAVPVQGIARSQLRDTFRDGRSRGRRHQAIDIMAARGTPVLAADDGRIARISQNRGGGLSIYQVDASGSFVYYYAHLDGYAPDLREGQALRRGDLLGYVGSTGNAPESAPHLHFAMLRLEQRGRWWGGEALNPYEALTQEETLTAARP